MVVSLLKSRASLLISSYLNVRVSFTLLHCRVQPWEPSVGKIALANVPCALYCNFGFFFCPFIQRIAQLYPTSSLSISFLEGMPNLLKYCSTNPHNFC